MGTRQTSGCNYEVVWIQSVVKDDGVASTGTGGRRGMGYSSHHSLR